MGLTRRQLGKLALAGMAGFEGGSSRTWAQQPNRSFIRGVQFGLQPFCYHDLAMNRENRPTLVGRLVQNGMGMVELHATWCEPRFDDPGVSEQEARDKLRQWRLSTPASYYENIKREFDSAGITIFTYYINIGESHTDAEIDAIFGAAKTLGATGVIGSYGLAIAQRLTAFPRKHGVFLGLHNHDNLSDPDAFASERSIEKGLSFSPDFKATLDTRHFTAANGDCLGFLERHHERVSSVHLGDRRKNNGRSTPFGEGDAPIIQILKLIQENRWPIVALVEFEHGTLRTGVAEVQLMFDYCKRRLDRRCGRKTIVSHKQRTLTFCALVLAAGLAAGQSVAPEAYDVNYIGPPLADAVMQHSKETFVLFGCSYCHGLNLVTRGEATDLMHSRLVGRDENGNLMGPLLRAGIPQTAKLSPMPQFSDLSDQQIADLVRWIHYARQQGRYKELIEDKAPPLGTVDAGQVLFDQKCASCHSTHGDLAKVSTKYNAARLKAQILRPTRLDSSPSWQIEILKDTNTAEARGRHLWLLENYTAADVANLTVYLGSAH